MTPAADLPPGRISTLAGFLGDFERLPTLTPITTQVRRLDPTAWPDADAIREAQGDEG